VILKITDTVIQRFMQRKYQTGEKGGGVFVFLTKTASEIMVFA